MSVGTGYQVDTAAMREVIRGLSDIAARASGSVGEMGALMIPTGCYGGVGTSVATANTALHGQSVVALRLLVSVVRDINSRMRRSVEGYEAADQEIATILSDLAASDQWGQHAQPSGAPRTSEV